jgi:hypothetical protein
MKVFLILNQVIAHLEKQKKLIFAQGEVAPVGCV